MQSFPENQTKMHPISDSTKDYLPLAAIFMTGATVRIATRKSPFPTGLGSRDGLA